MKHDQAPNIEPGAKGKLRYDKVRRTIVGEPQSVSVAWEIVLKWLDDYTEEEATFSRYQDDVILDGIMTAAQRRAMADLFPKTSRIKKQTDDRCENCGNKLPLMFPCYYEECPIPGSY